MRPLMRLAEAMHDNEVRKASKAAIAAIPDARKACDALTALTGIGVATASVCLAAVDDRLPVMSDEALEAVLGEPEHAKKYDLDSYQRLLEACSTKARKLGGLWTPRAVEEALFLERMLDNEDWVVRTKPDVPPLKPPTPNMCSETTWRS